MVCVPHPALLSEGSSLRTLLASLPCLRKKEWLSSEGTPRRLSQLLLESSEIGNRKKDFAKGPRKPCTLRRRGGGGPCPLLGNLKHWNIHFKKGEKRERKL